MINDNTLVVRNRIVSIKLIPYSTATGAALEASTLIGIPTGGSINVDGASAVRHSCNITLVTNQKPDCNWSLETEFKVIICVAPIAPGFGDEEVREINQGHFIITQFSYNEAITGKFDISIAGQDKMCLLNGEIDGKFPYEVDFGNYNEYDANGELTVRQLTIPEILSNLLFFFGRNSYNPNKIIGLAEEEAYELLEYRGDSPLYMLLNKDDEGKIGVSNLVVYGDQCDKNGTRIDALERYYEPQSLTVGPSITGDSAYTHSSNFELGDNQYKVQKVEYGDIAGYNATDLVYPGELVAAAGETVTSVLDKIKNVLGDYEYYFDTDGEFCFTKKPCKIGLEFAESDSNDYGVVLVTNTDTNNVTQFDFSDKTLLTSVSNSPDIKNIKNDYAVWGSKKSVSGANLPIHTRIAIDQKPESTNGLDWRETIYQEALDYYAALGDTEHPERLNSNTWYYRDYYTDLLGFWRQLYNPNDTGHLEDTEDTTAPSLHRRQWEQVNTYNPNLSVSELYVKKMCGYKDNQPDYCYVPWQMSWDLYNLIYRYGNEQRTLRLNELYQYNQQNNRYLRMFHDSFVEDDVIYFYKGYGDTSYLNMRQAAESYNYLNGIGGVNYSNLYHKALDSNNWIPYGYSVKAEQFTPKANTNTYIYGIGVKTRNSIDLVNVSTLRYFDNGLLIESSASVFIEAHPNGFQTSSILNYKTYRGGNIWYAAMAQGIEFYYLIYQVPENESERLIGYKDAEGQYHSYAKYLTLFHNYSFNELTLYVQESLAPITLKNVTTPRLMELNKVPAAGELLESEVETPHILPLPEELGGANMIPLVEKIKHLLDLNNLFLKNGNTYEEFLPLAIQGMLHSEEEAHKLYRLSNDFTPIYNTTSLLSVNAEDTSPFDAIVVEGESTQNYEDYEVSSALLGFDITPSTEVYYMTNTSGNLYGVEKERIVKYQTRIFDFDAFNHWNKMIFKEPETLTFWFDLIDEPELLENYGKIGRRIHVAKDQTVTAIQHPAKPNAKFGQNFNIQIPEHLSGMFAISSQGKSSFDAIGDLLYNHTYITNALNLTSIPIYDLKPNHLIKFEDEYYNVDKLTIPLNYNGTMTITATKLPALDKSEQSS